MYVVPSILTSVLDPTSIIFLPDDIANVKSYIISDVIVPAIKKTVSDIVDSFLYPDGRGRRRSSGSSVSYNSYYDGKRDSRKNSSQPRSSLNVNKHLDEIIIDNRGDAEKVLDGLFDYLETYEVVSVGDLYELLGLSSNSSYVDEKYGWTDLSEADVVRVRDGWKLRLPRVSPLR